MIFWREKKKTGSWPNLYPMNTTAFIISADLNVIGVRCQKCSIVLVSTVGYNNNNIQIRRKSHGLTHPSHWHSLSIFRIVGIYLAGDRIRTILLCILFMWISPFCVALRKCVFVAAFCIHAILFWCAYVSVLDVCFRRFFTEMLFYTLAMLCFLDSHSSSNNIWICTRRTKNSNAFDVDDLAVLHRCSYSGSILSSLFS